MKTIMNTKWSIAEELHAAPEFFKDDRKDAYDLLWVLPMRAWRSCRETVRQGETSELAIWTIRNAARIICHELVD